MNKKPLFSICIPAYNRVQFLSPLLDSIISQNFNDYEIVICEDKSAERQQISDVVNEYLDKYNSSISYYENETNIGYDANIRKLIEKSNGEFCFFMGNDDLMCEGALEEVARLIQSRDNIGMVLKSYSWFNDSPSNIVHTVRYFSDECDFNAGKQAIHACFRRSGVIAGYIINREAAFSSATEKFDGTLYYQMHLTSHVLTTMNAVFTPKVLVLCRNGQPPEFGNSSSEQGKYTPGRYTAQARINMIAGVVAIIKDLKDSKGIDIIDEILSDYANYFYPYIKDQLRLSISEYWWLYLSFGRLGFRKYPMFHIYMLIAYLLGTKRFDWIIAKMQQLLGRSIYLSKITKKS